MVGTAIRARRARVGASQIAATVGSSRPLIRPVDCLVQARRRDVGDMARPGGHSFG